MAPCPPLKSLWAAAAGCNSSDSETDGWHPVYSSKPSGQPQQVAILRIPCPPLKTLWAAAADCNSSDSETDGWHPVRPSKPSAQPQQVASLGIPRLTDGALSLQKHRYLRCFCNISRCCLSTQKMQKHCTLPMFCALKIVEK